MALVERSLSSFQSKPLSVRRAVNVIVVPTIAVVVLGGILMRLVDREEYASVWEGMWWALQTVTTVGYGDVVPKDPAGRLIAVFVMLEGVAFVAIVTAAITSSFVAREQRRREAQTAGEGEQARTDTRAIHSRLDELHTRFDRIEALLSRPTEVPRPPERGARPPT